MLNRFLWSIVIENLERTLIRWSKNLCGERHRSLTSLATQICHVSVLLYRLIFDIYKTGLLLPVLHSPYSSFLHFMCPWLIWTDRVRPFLWAKSPLARLRRWSSSNAFSVWVIILEAVPLIVIVLIEIRSSCHASTKKWRGLSHQIKAYFELVSPLDKVVVLMTRIFPTTFLIGFTLWMYFCISSL